MNVAIELISKPWSLYRYFVRVNGEVRFLCLDLATAEASAAALKA